MNRYFELSIAIERGKEDREFRAAIRAARETYPLLPSFVVQWKREYGTFDIVTSHAVHTAPRLMAIMEDADGIRELRAALEHVEELKVWLPAAKQAEHELALVRRIMFAVAEQPGLLQSSLKKRLGLADGSEPSQLVAGLEKGGRISRVRKGASYQLYPAGYAIPTVNSAPTDTLSSLSSVDLASGPTIGASGGSAALLPTVAASPPRAWTRRVAEKARLLEFSGLPIVRLPKAPLAWEERDVRGGGTDSSLNQKKKGEPNFVVEAENWTIAAVEKLAPAERPDPAFKKVFHTGHHTHWLDPKGKREGFEYAASVLRVTGREGQVSAERGLGYDVCRSDVNADGTGILFLSREGVLHGYTDALVRFLEVRLHDLPEYQVQAQRLGIEPRELKNHTRCVAISSDKSRYLVTVVDEAWCLDTTTGDVVWGFRMPTNEGWIRRVANRSERTGTSTQIEAALQLMQIELPVTPNDIARQYRALAMKWHPDRNPGDKEATTRFQDLGAAMELLTGSDLSRLSKQEAEQVTYEQILSTTRINNTDGVGGVFRTDMSISVHMVISEKSAADWIYAANLGKDGRAFLAGYSGKVVVVSPRGIPALIYDIGAVPRQIIDAGEHLYILTDTRLYVVSGDRLEALIDVYGAGDLVVTDNGFALLEPKAFTWFTPYGQRVGVVRTKAPIRRAFSTSAGTVVETREHRCVIAGSPAWWK